MHVPVTGCIVLIHYYNNYTVSRVSVTSSVLPSMVPLWKQRTFRLETFQKRPSVMMKCSDHHNIFIPFLLSCCHDASSRCLWIIILYNVTAALCKSDCVHKIFIAIILYLFQHDPCSIFMHSTNRECEQYIKRVACISDLLISVHVQGMHGTNRNDYNNRYGHTLRN